MLSRLKLQIATNGPVLAVACVVVGLLALAGAGYVYATPGVEQQPPEEVDSFEIETSLAESAVVQRSNPLYETGQRLHSRPAYLRNATPELTLSATVSATDDRAVTVTQRVILQEQAARDDMTFWTRERVLATNQETVTDGQVQTNATVDVDELAGQQAEVAAAIEAISRPTASIRLETEYETEPVAGEPYEGELLVTTDLRMVENAYWIAGERTAADSEQRLVEQEPRELSPNILLSGLLVLIGLSMFVMAGVIVQQSQLYDPQELRIEVYEDEYGEWISSGELVVDPSKQYVYVNSLKDLVNIGIDADKRVIHDADLEAYVVVDSGLIYYFAREPTNIELWANVGGPGDGNQS